MAAAGVGHSSHHRPMSTRHRLTRPLMAILAVALLAAPSLQPALAQDAADPAGACGRGWRDVLLRELPRLQAAGVRFVTVSELLALRRAGAGGAS